MKKYRKITYYVTSFGDLYWHDKSKQWISLETWRNDLNLYKSNLSSDAVALTHKKALKIVNKIPVNTSYRISIFYRRRNGTLYLIKEMICKKK
jgi:hypothetical protein